jgi:site-specific DNA-methyltransferase (adenine-specific)
MLIRGNCLEEMKKMEDKSVDCIITDPPYGINFKSNHRKEKFDILKNDNNLDFLKPFIRESFRILKDNSHIYIWTRWDVYHKFYEIISKYFTIKNCLIVKRTNTSMGDLTGQFAPFYEMVIFAHKGRKEFYKTEMHIKDGKSHPRFKGDTIMNGYVTRFADLIEELPSGENRYLAVHPTQKAIKIHEFFINLSSKEGDTILDPFMGSGTTGVACKNLNREFIGIELDENYFKIAQERIKKCVKEGLSEQESGR